MSYPFMARYTTTIRNWEMFVGVKGYWPSSMTMLYALRIIIACYC